MAVGGESLAWARSQRSPRYNNRKCDTVRAGHRRVQQEGSSPRAQASSTRGQQPLGGRCLVTAGRGAARHVCHAGQEGSNGVGKWRAQCDNGVCCGSIEGTVTKDPSKDGPGKILRNLGCGCPRCLSWPGAGDTWEQGWGVCVTD